MCFRLTCRSGPVAVGLSTAPNLTAPRVKRRSGEIPRYMSGEYFYVRFRFSPKIGVRTRPAARQHEAVVEVPKYLVQRRQLELINKNPREKVIALDFARRAALAVFS